jgi:hypothetical protein
LAEPAGIPASASKLASAWATGGKARTVDGVAASAADRARPTDGAAGATALAS